jgi:hypothetical protein
MRHAYLLVVLLFTLSSCGKVTSNEYEKNTPVVSGDSVINKAITSNTERSEITKFS